MVNTDLNNLIDKYISTIKKELISFPFVSAFIWYGSSIREIKSISSDIDLIIIIKESSTNYINEIIHSLYFVYSTFNGLCYPSINIWPEQQAFLFLPYYITSLKNNNLKIIFDKTNKFSQMIDRLKDLLKSGRVQFLTEKFRSNSFFQTKKDKSEKSKKIDLSILKKGYYNKYLQIRKYLPLYFKRRDYNLTIEQTNKAAYYLLFSYLAGKGLHFHNIREIYFFYHKIQIYFENPHLSKILYLKYFLDSLKKIITPFSNLATKELAKKSLTIFEEYENLILEGL